MCTGSYWCQLPGLISVIMTACQEIPRLQLSHKSIHHCITCKLAERRYVNSKQYQDSQSYGISAMLLTNILNVAVVFSCHLYLGSTVFSSARTTKLLLLTSAEKTDATSHMSNCRFFKKTIDILCTKSQPEKAKCENFLKHSTKQQQVATTVAAGTQSYHLLYVWKAKTIK